MERSNINQYYSYIKWSAFFLITYRTRFIIRLATFCSIEAAFKRYRQQTEKPILLFQCVKVEGKCIFTTERLAFRIEDTLLLCNFIVFFFENGGTRFSVSYEAKSFLVFWMALTLNVRSFVRPLYNQSIYSIGCIQPQTKEQKWRFSMG